MRVPQLLDLPGLSIGFVSTVSAITARRQRSVRNHHHHHAPLQRSPKCTIKASHQTGSSPTSRSRFRTSHKLLHTPALQPLRATPSKTHSPALYTAPPQLSKKRPTTSDLAPPASSKQRPRTQHLSRATATTDVATEGKKRKAMASTRSKCRAPLSINACGCCVPLTMPAVSFDSCRDPMLRKGTALLT